jgi:acyl carrier protein
MTRETVTEAVIDGLRRVAPDTEPASLREDALLRDALGIDSYDFLSFLVGLRDALGVEIPEADYGRLTTLAAVVDYLCARIGCGAVTSRNPGVPG